MRVPITEVEDVFSDVLSSSRNDYLVVHAFFDGELVAHDLPVASWTLDWSYGRSAHGQATLVISDDDGSLSPWAMSDPLGPGGTQLQITYVFGATDRRVLLGWWRIRSVTPVEQWIFYDRNGGREPAFAGASITVQADELTCMVDMYRMDAVRPQRLNSCIEEVESLLDEIMPVTVHDDVVDGPLPSLLIYDESRVSAVNDVLNGIKAEGRMAPDGSLEVVPREGVGPVWEVSPGEDGALISVSRTISDEGVYNAVIAHGTTDAGVELTGRAYITSGKRAWNGPYGQVPLFHSSLATSQNGIQTSAETMLRNREITGTVPIEVEVLANPAIQIYDRITVNAPSRAGMVQFSGWVSHMSIGTTADTVSSPAAKKSMSLTLQVIDDELEALAEKVRMYRGS